MIRRRAFLAAATAGLFARPMVGAEHRARKLRQVGYLGGSSQAVLLVESFRQGLRDHGYVENENLMLTIRWGEASADRLRQFAAELVALGVEVIVAGPDSSIAAAKQASSTIPVVMCLSTDPVQAGFVRTLSRPGGNVTGLTLEASSEIHGKRLELLKEAFPAVSQVRGAWESKVPRTTLLSQACRLSRPSAGRDRSVSRRERAARCRRSSPIVDQPARRGAFRGVRSPCVLAPPQDSRARGQTSLSRHVFSSGLGRCWRADGVWTEPG